KQDFQITQAKSSETVTLKLSGPADTRHVDKAIIALREAIATEKQIELDFSKTRAIDARFLGLLLMLKKTLAKTGRAPVFVGMPPVLTAIFSLNGLAK